MDRIAYKKLIKMALNNMAPDLASPHVNGKKSPIALNYRDTLDNVDPWFEGAGDDRNELGAIMLEMIRRKRERQERLKV